MDFQPFPKLSRWSRDVVISEKLDGTNAQIFFERVAEVPRVLEGAHLSQDGLDYRMWIGSRTQWITPEKDNFGFAGWCYKHAPALLKLLGEGQHFGEWWGSGIQRNYGLKEKRFSLFNTHRWGPQNTQNDFGVGVVPVLWAGNADNLNSEIHAAMNKLQGLGSVAAPGFMNPEGIVIYHTKGNALFKKTFEKDETGKWEQ